MKAPRAATGECGMGEIMEYEPSGMTTKSDPRDRIKSDHIKPNPTKKTEPPGSRRGPLDQNWRGRASIWVELVGGEEVLNGCMGKSKA